MSSSSNYERVSNILGELMSCIEKNDKAKFYALSKSSKLVLHNSSIGDSFLEGKIKDVHKMALALWVH